MAALFAALAFAIWSRRAADDFRAEDGAGSEASVGLSGEIEGMVLSHVFSSGPSADKLSPSSSLAEVIDGRDGFWNKPPVDARAFEGLDATVCEPVFGGSFP